MSNRDPNLIISLQEREQLTLSPVNAYYIRRLLRRNLDRLELVTASKTGVKANALSDPNTVIKSFYEDNEKINAVVLDLERLISSHQALNTHRSKHLQELADLERRIFELLGFKWQELERQRTILIVDDVPDNLSLLSFTLAQKGYDIHSAASGKMALAKVRSILPDLILLDIMMPGMNGYEVCERLKDDTLLQDIPIIFVSAVGDALEKVRGFEVGGVDYITKPFQIEEVLARVEHQLNTRSLQRRLEQQNIRLQQEMRDRKQAEEQYRSIVENSVDGIFQISPDGKYLSANLALARICGYESPQELTTQIDDVGRQLYIQPHRRAEFIAYMRQYDTVSDFESQVYRKDGSIIWISEDVRTVTDADGKLLYYEGTVKDITERKYTEEELRHARRNTEQLLLNVLPQQIAERLKKGETVIADNYAEATVLFADIVDFTPFAAQIAPTELVGFLNRIFSAFDRLVEQYGLEKIKTVGDAYMAVGGLPELRADHAEAVAELALAMQQVSTQFQRDTGEPFHLRIGINTGPVVAGVIGTKKFSYDLWGNTVNIASRMESEGMAGKIQVTAATHRFLTDQYLLKPRGTIRIKGRGEMMTYWLMGRKG